MATTPTPHTSPTPQGTGADLLTLLDDQIEFHLRQQARPRLDGLTDEEYFFDPTSDGSAWTVHPRPAEGEEPRTSVQGGGGELVIDFAMPPPDPEPFTTIAWRLGHVIVGVLAMRSHGHFGGPEVDYMTWDYAGTAAEALDQFDREYARWREGVAAWSEEDLRAPCGPAEGPWAEASRATLVAHINRELIHHLAEVALLRDLWTHTRS